MMPKRNPYASAWLEVLAGAFLIEADDDESTEAVASA